MSSGDKKTTNNTVAEPPKWAIPYFQSALNKAGSIASQPYVGYNGARIADFSDDQYDAFNMVRQGA